MGMGGLKIWGGGFGVPNVGFLGGGFGVFGGVWRSLGPRRAGALCRFVYGAVNRKRLHRKCPHRKPEAEGCGADGSECGAGNVGRCARSCGAESSAPSQRGGVGRPHIYGAGRYGAGRYGAQLYGAVLCFQVRALWGSPTCMGQGSLRQGSMGQSSMGQPHICGAGLYGAELYGAAPHLWGRALWGSPTSMGQSFME